MKSVMIKHISDINKYPSSEIEYGKKLKNLITQSNRKIIVLDDDPTGIQTIHGVSVFTNWKKESILEGFCEQNNIFFVLTNSRSFTEQETKDIHEEIAEYIVEASKKTGKDYIVVSRGDSTLRGHFPLETNTLRLGIEKYSDKRYSGEIICPFFKEGGRFTFDDIHYVQQGDALIPAGETEFAKDKSFGFESSNLKEWCEEKTNGEYHAKDVVSISLKDLRKGDIKGIKKQLMSVENFNKVIVNAIDYSDLECFLTAYYQVLNMGKEFLFRTAAPITKVISGIKSIPLLTRENLIDKSNKNGGIIIVGSHVNKTTEQLENLKKSELPITFIEFNQHLVVEEAGLEPEIQRTVDETNKAIKLGKTVCVFTRRDRFDLPEDASEDSSEAQLQVSVRISNAITSIVARLSARPSFVIAKGGITSSEIGTQALKVEKATVMGQIEPGIPVWMTGNESRFPLLPYVIFPGNVGNDNSLSNIVDSLMNG